MLKIEAYRFNLTELYGNDPKNKYKPSLFIEYYSSSFPEYLRYEFTQAQLDRYSDDDDGLTLFIYRQLQHYCKDSVQFEFPDNLNTPYQQTYAYQTLSNHWDSIIDSLIHFIRSEHEERTVIFNHINHDA